MPTETEVTFPNHPDKTKLSGTLSLPDVNQEHPCVILISGSGPQTRDQDILGHKLFKDIADFFTRRDIAVLRFDDPGAGKSEGVFADAGLRDFAGDVLAAGRKSRPNCLRIGTICFKRPTPAYRKNTHRSKAAFPMRCWITLPAGSTPGSRYLR